MKKGTLKVPFYVGLKLFTFNLPHKIIVSIREEHKDYD